MWYNANTDGATPTPQPQETTMENKYEANHSLYIVYTATAGGEISATVSGIEVAAKAACLDAVDVDWAIDEDGWCGGMDDEGRYTASEPWDKPASKRARKSMMNHLLGE
jgi:hypothetical protein